MGLVPPAAELGDVIEQFRNCDAAIVMRPLANSTATAIVASQFASLFVIIGRADVAEGYDRQAGWEDADSREGSWPSGGALHVEFSLRTLQIVTAHISTARS